MNTRRPTILVTGADLATEALALLHGHEIVYAGKAPSDADIVGLCARHDPTAIIVRYGRIGAAAMDAAPRLKVISKHGSGTDTIDKAAAAARGIRVVAAVGANAAAVAEHAMALLLACAKSVVGAERAHACGLLGQGDAPQRRARRSHDRRHRARCDRSPLRADGRCDGHAGARFRPVCRRPAGLRCALRDLDTIWRSADAISLHCPLTSENARLLNDETLAACKRGVIVVNTARGGLVDEAALLASIRAGHVACAGLDSFAVEPMAAPHPFHGEPRIVLSPHIGGVTSDAYREDGRRGGAQPARRALQD